MSVQPGQARSSQARSDQVNLAMSSQVNQIMSGQAQSRRCTVHPVLTPSHEEEGPDQSLSRAEGVRHDYVQVKSLAEHPGKVAGRAVLGQHVQRLTPHLHATHTQHYYT